MKDTIDGYIIEDGMKFIRREVFENPLTFTGHYVRHYYATKNRCGYDDSTITDDQHLEIMNYALESAILTYHQELRNI